MSQRPVSLSPDLKRLRDEGYAVHVRSNHLLVSGVPYVNSRKVVARGTLVSELTLAGEVAAAPSTHVMLFIGDHPCNKDGTEIAQIKHGSDQAGPGQRPGGEPLVLQQAAGRLQGLLREVHEVHRDHLPPRPLHRPVGQADDFLPVTTVEKEIGVPLLRHRVEPRGHHRGVRASWPSAMSRSSGSAAPGHTSWT